MQLPLVVDHLSPHPLQGQIYSQIIELVVQDCLLPGTRLPSTRALSEQLGVSRNTVKLAYDRLLDEGYLETRAAAGTFISRELPEQCLRLQAEIPPEPGPVGPMQPGFRTVFRGTPPNLYLPEQNRLLCDFRIGRPDPRLFPARHWQRLLSEQMSGAGFPLTQYGDPAGLPALREAIATHLRFTRGIRANPEQVIIVAGSQGGLNVVARLFAGRDTRVVMENPTYRGAACLFESYGIRVDPVPVDRQGLRVDRLPAAGARLAYVTPSHQFPLGGTLPLERRFQLLRWAVRSGACIIEDDYDSDFRYHGSPLMALYGLSARPCVIYLGTFSKSLGSGLRIGYLVVPAGLIEPATTVKALLDNGHPWLDQAVLAEFIRSGALERHLRRIRHTYMSRRDCLVDALRAHFRSVELAGPGGGMHLSWWLPPGSPPARELQAMVAAKGVGIYSLADGPAHAYGDVPEAERLVLLGYSGLPEPRIRAGIALIAETLKGRR